MAGDLKVCVIGGGSSYTPELIEGLLERRAELPVRQVALMDIDERKLGIVGGLAERMVAAAGGGLELDCTLDRARAIDGARFVVTQIRVGQMAARVLDEKIPPRFGMIGQETTGPGGFAKALRTIPVILDVAREMEARAPGAFLLNFTNPAGLVTEALQRYSPVPSIGLCNLPIGVEMRLAERFGVERRAVQLDWVGLNHLNWVRGARIAGREAWAEVFAGAVEDARRHGADDWNFSAELLETLGLLPCGYLNYFYHHERALAKQRRAPRTRGEEVQEVEAGLMALYQDPNLKEKPALLAKRGGAHYSTAAISLMAAIANDRREVHIVNTRNGGALPDLPAEAVVEVPCEIGAGGARPLPAQPMPPEIGGLVQAVKAYEQLAAVAAVEGDRRRALQALLAHPLVPSYDAACGVLNALLEAHRAYLPRFFPEG